jgi:hypothetical protein
MSSLLYDDTSHPSLLVKLLWLCPKNPRPTKGHLHPKHANGASVVVLPKSSPRWGPHVTSMLQPCPKDIWYYQVFFKWTIDRSQLDLMPLQSGENSKLVGSPLIFEISIIDVLPSSLIDSNVSLEWKQRKSKESGHTPWLATLWG